MKCAYSDKVYCALACDSGGVDTSSEETLRGSRCTPKEKDETAEMRRWRLSTREGETPIGATSIPPKHVVDTTNTSSRSSTSFVGSWAVDVHHFRLFTSVTCTHLAVRDAPGHCQCTATSCTLQTLSGARGKLVVFCLDSWSEQLTMRFVPWCTHGFWFFCFSLGLVCPPVPAATPASWRKSCQH